MVKAFQQKAKLAKRCPCCGGKNLITEKLEFLAENNLHLVKIICDDCDLALTEYMDPEDADYRSAYRRLLLKWNRRAA